MFYEPRKRNHGLAHDPFKACVVPRPIGWVSTLSSSGVVNLAPYSFFNAVSAVPPMVMFSSNGLGPDGPKDSRRNCEETGEFVINVATWALREELNQSSFAYPADVDEMQQVGLAAAKCELVAVPRVADCPIAMECKYWKTIELPGQGGPSNNAIVLGEVVGIHIDDAVFVDGQIDIAKLRPIARMGYMDFAVVDSVFTMPRPSSAS
jgi:flavin reductase (DIM6/NTAB) family NADH-FMN oxidoreductase RutF